MGNKIKQFRAQIHRERSSSSDCSRCSHMSESMPTCSSSTDSSSNPASGSTSSRYQCARFTSDCITCTGKEYTWMLVFLAGSRLAVFAV